ncbi:MAG: ankyrin repeat domain-containing protein [Sedimentisphaerales bacterium]
MDAVIEQINSTGKAFIDFALPMLIQSSVLIVVLLGLDIILRKKIRAVFRYWIWMIVLLKLVLPPTLSSPTSVAYWVGNSMRTSVTERPFAEPRSRPMSLILDQSVKTPGFAESGIASSEVKEALIENDITPYASIDVEASSPGLMSSLTWQGYAFLSWLVAVVIMTVLLIQRMFFVRRLIVESAEPDEAMLIVLNGACEQMGITKGIALRIPSATASPSVCGLLQSTILVPQKLIRKLDSRDLKSILLHELAHIKRRDLWVSSFQTIVQIVYIYNPLLWVANAIIRKVREQAVDEMVLVAMGEQAEEYPKTLLNISRLAFGRSALSLRLIGVAESKKALISRVTHITGRPFPTDTKLGFVGFLIVAVLCVVLLPMAKAEKPDEGNVSLARGDDEKPTKSFWRAVNDGDIEQVKLHLKTSTSINARDHRGRTALHNAVSRGYTELAKLLISKGADVNARNENDWTPLHYAAKNGRIDEAKLLIDKGASPNTKDRWLGWTPIHRAARGGHKEIVELLLVNGVDVNSGNIYDQTPAEVAMEANHNEIVKLLMSKGADVSPLLVAVHMKDLAKARNLIEAGADVNKRTLYGTSPLHRAAAAGFKDIAVLLIEKGADVNAKDNRGRTPLHDAAEKGHKEIVELLVAKGADVHAGASCGISAAEVAMSGNHDEIVKLLISRGADISPLHLALYMNDRTEVRRLIGNGADVNRRTQYGTTPLHMAVRACSKDVVELLIEKGADVNAKDNYNWTPLHIAVYENEDVVELLIGKGADVNAREGDGRTPLSCAEEQGHKEITKLLIANGADVDSNTGNWTALHTAAEEGNKDATALHIAKGVNVNAQDWSGRTALHIAASKGHKEIVELLVANGANVSSGTQFNRSAAELAMRENHNEIVELLISKGADISPLHFALHLRDRSKARRLIEGGADVNRRTPYGTAPLHMAVRVDFRDIAALLIEKGADVNVQDNWRWTPLHSAVYGHKDMVELLIAKGANVNARDGGDRTPLLYAQDQGHTEIVELLKKHGAKE